MTSDVIDRRHPVAASCRHAERRAIAGPARTRTKEAAMSNRTDLIDRYIAIWNETDAVRRRDLIASTWTETASYLDPLMQGDGQSGIDAMIQAVQERFPGHRF